MSDLQPIPATSIRSTFESNHWLTHINLKDVSHADSLMRPEFKANPLNWVLGHIIRGRNRALSYLERPLVWDEATISIYTSGSGALEDAQALSLEQLIADLDATQEAILVALSEVSAAYLNGIVETPFGEQPRWQAVSGLGWHETYHLGQFELLRQMIKERQTEAA
jgi:hypothetical protein